MTQPLVENKMGIMPIKKLLITMALPMMISMFVQALYNVVDSIFVARIGEDALTAVSMAYPFQNLMIGTAIGTAVGVNALIARSLGEKNRERANHCAHNGLFLAIASYVVFFLLGLFATRTFFQVQTQIDAIVDYGTTYLFLCLVGSLGFFSNVMLERLLHATGRTGLTMYTQGLGAVTNLILDPILIFGLGPIPQMGIAGAAVATLIGQWAAAALSLFFNLKYNEEITLSFKGFRPDPAIIKQIYIIGVPVIIMNSIGSVMVFGMNIILTSFTSTATAVLGIHYKVQSFAFMPVFGLNNALIPIASYNLGAKNKERIDQSLRMAIVYGVVIMLIALTLIQCLAPQILWLFDASAEMLAIGVPALRVISTSFLFAGFIVVVSGFCQALGRSFFSMLISIIRQLVVLLPVAWLLSLAGDVSLVWFAYPIAEVVTFIVAIIYLRKLYRTVITPLGNHT